MDRTSRSGERHDGTEAKDLGRDVRAMAPASGEGSESALEMWKRRARARALLNAREPRRFRSETRARRDGERPT
ncbi:MAG: hypothetical protein ACYC0T_13515 [Ramlibacter sp.]